MEERVWKGGGRKDMVKECKGKSPWEVLVRLVTETKTRPQNSVLSPCLFSRDSCDGCCGLRRHFYFPARKYDSACEE
jgi:hypothetical protein